MMRSIKATSTRIRPAGDNIENKADKMEEKIVKTEIVYVDLGQEYIDAGISSSKEIKDTNKPANKPVIKPISMQKAKVYLGPDYDDIDDSLFDSERIEGRNILKPKNESITNSNKTHMPASLLQRDPYLDIQRFASEQEKNNYESIRHDHDYCLPSKRIMSSDSNKLVMSSDVLNTKYNIQQSDELTYGERNARNYDDNKYSIENDKQTPTNSIRKNYEYNGEVNK